MALRRNGRAAGTDIFPGFADVSELGTNGPATIFRAREIYTDRKVTLKVLDVRGVAARTLESFHREAAVVGALSAHPNIATLFRTFAISDGRPVLVLQQSPAPVADRLSSDRHLPVRQAVSIAVKIASALETAHRAGILHRDVKPESILITESGEPLLADFGVAALRPPAETPAGLFDFSAVHVAPELLAGGQASPASDVYELASTLMHLITGRPAFRPFVGESPASVIERILHEAVPPVLADGVPVALTDVLVQAMSKNVHHRPASAVEFARGLLQIESQRAWSPTQFLIRDAPPGTSPVITPPPDAQDMTALDDPTWLAADGPVPAPVVTSDPLAFPTADPPVEDAWPEPVLRSFHGTPDVPVDVPAANDTFLDRVEPIEFSTSVDLLMSRNGAAFLDSNSSEDPHLIGPMTLDPVSAAPSRDEVPASIDGSTLIGRAAPPVDWAEPIEYATSAELLAPHDSAVALDAGSPAGGRELLGPSLLESVLAGLRRAEPGTSIEAGPPVGGGGSDDDDLGFFDAAALSFDFPAPRNGASLDSVTPADRGHDLPVSVNIAPPVDIALESHFPRHADTALNAPLGRAVDNSGSGTAATILESLGVAAPITAPAAEAVPEQPPAAKTPAPAQSEPAVRAVPPAPASAERAPEPGPRVAPAAPLWTPPDPGRPVVPPAGAQLPAPAPAMWSAPPPRQVAPSAAPLPSSTPPQDSSPVQQVPGNGRIASAAMPNGRSSAALPMQPPAAPAVPQPSWSPVRVIGNGSVAPGAAAVPNGYAEVSNGYPPAAPAVQAGPPPVARPPAGPHPPVGPPAGPPAGPRPAPPPNGQRPTGGYPIRPSAMSTAHPEIETSGHPAAALRTGRTKTGAPQSVGDLMIDPGALGRRLKLHAGLSALTVDERRLTLRSGGNRTHLSWHDVLGFEPSYEGPGPDGVMYGCIVAMTTTGPLPLPATRGSVAEVRYAHAMLDAYRMRALGGQPR